MQGYLKLSYSIAIVWLFNTACKKETSTIPNQSTPTLTLNNRCLGTSGSKILNKGKKDTKSKNPANRHNLVSKNKLGEVTHPDNAVESPVKNSACSWTMLDSSGKIIRQSPYDKYGNPRDMFPRNTSSPQSARRNSDRVIVFPAKYSPHPGQKNKVSPSNSNMNNNQDDYVDLKFDIELEQSW